MPRGDTSSTSMLPRRSCSACTVIVTCSSFSRLAALRSFAVTIISAVAPSGVIGRPSLEPCGSAKAIGDCHHACGLTRSHVLAASTMAHASSLPKPYLWLYHLPDAVICQSGSFGFIWTAVRTQRCCMSRQVSSGRTSRTSAKIPAAIGAAAEVPPWRSVQVFLPTSVVCCSAPPWSVHGDRVG